MNGTHKRKILTNCEQTLKHGVNIKYNIPDMPVSQHMLQLPD